MGLLRAEGGVKVGTLPSERLRSDRKWAPERLALGEAPSACECRVCGQSIAEHEMSWGWRWKSTSRGHAVCGWYTLNDVDGVSAILGLGDLRFMPAPRARQRAHELFIMECTTDADG